MKKSALFAAICVPAFLAGAPLAAKTLVYCSEGSPENFYPGINTTGTSFDVNEHIYDNIVDFERGGTKVVPGLAEKWDVSADGTRYLASAGLTLLSAMEDWQAAEPELLRLAATLKAGGGGRLDAARLRAPLPRTWQRCQTSFG